MADKALYHFSKKILKLNRKKSYIQDNAWDKPNGLWLSHLGDGGWESMCRQESFHLDRLKRSAKVTLNDSANILVLGSLEEINKFINKYAVGKHKNSTEETIYFIDWDSVVKDYDGIQIINYDRELMDSFEFSKTDKSYAMPNLWYDTLSCDSMCVWNLEAIKRVENMLVIKNDYLHLPLVFYIDIALGNSIRILHYDKGR